MIISFLFQLIIFFLKRLVWKISSACGIPLRWFSANHQNIFMRWESGLAKSASAPGEFSPHSRPRIRYLISHASCVNWRDMAAGLWCCFLCHSTSSRLTESAYAVCVFLSFSEKNVAVGLIWPSGAAAIAAEPLSFSMNMQPAAIFKRFHPSSLLKCTTIISSLKIGQCKISDELELEAIPYFMQLDLRGFVALHRTWFHNFPTFKVWIGQF